MRQHASPARVSHLMCIGIRHVAQPTAQLAGPNELAELGKPYESVISRVAKPTTACSWDAAAAWA